MSSRQRCCVVRQFFLFLSFSGRLQMMPMTQMLSLHIINSFRNEVDRKADVIGFFNWKLVSIHSWLKLHRPRDLLGCHNAKVVPKGSKRSIKVDKKKSLLIAHKHVSDFDLRSHMKLVVDHKERISGASNNELLKCPLGEISQLMLIDPS